ncbi:DUF4209 domain-containing protein [Cellulomonas sp. NPDC057328]|uniref:DUF4209 domain-containing protein n=1 Tax=Cellulomonas sp. NPDC057328 TaxID=3346101 RepID=UPI003638AB61
MYELTERLRSEFGPEPPSSVRALAQAMDYHPRSADVRDEPYGPMIELADGRQYPEPLSQVGEPTLAVWQEAADELADVPLVAARLNDLLWVSRAKPRPDQHARAAVDAYAGLWDSEGQHAVDKAHQLVRALTISQELRDASLAASVVDAMVRALKETLASAEWSPGVALRLATPLGSLPLEVRPQKYGELLDMALTRYADDPFIVQDVVALQLALAGGQTHLRRPLARVAIDAWEKRADEASDFASLNYLERALELATNEGMVSDADRLRSKLEVPRTPDELGMQRVATEVSIPVEEIERFVENVLGGDDVAIWLARLALQCPLDGDLDQVQEIVRSQMAEYPLQHLFSTVVLDSDGMPVAHVVTDDQKFERAVAQHESMGIGLWANFVVEVLARATARGATGEAVKQFVEASAFDTAGAASMGRAFGHYIAGDYEASLFVLLPRIERAVRRIARSLGLSIYEEPRTDGTRYGNYKGLGELLRILKGRAPEAQRRYMSRILVDRLGLNLRNRGLHGLMEEATAADAALAIHIGLILGTWQVAQAPDVGATEPDQAAEEDAGS